MTPIDFFSAQPTNLVWKVDPVVPAKVVGYALLVTNDFFSIGSDAQGQFDSI